jgi:hypothetical protein
MWLQFKRRCWRKSTLLIAVVDLFVKVGVVCSAYCADLKVASRDVRDILKEANRFAAIQRC